MRTIPLMLFLSGCLDLDAAGNLVPPTVVEDPDLPSVTIADTTLRVETLGDPADPLLVLIHGGPGADLDGMRRLGALADEGFHVLAYDQRGAGRSERHDPESFDADAHIDDLVALVDQYSEEGTAVLLGHSWGGQLATRMVQLHPERVEAVILLDPGPFTGERWNGLGLTAIDMTARHLNELFWAERMVTPDGHERLDWHFQQLLSGQLAGYHMSESDPMPFSRMGYVGYNDTLRGQIVDGSAVWDFTPGLQEWEGTAHFLWGGANTIMTPAYREAQEADYPRTTSLTMDGVGHDLPWIAADDVVDHVLEVL